jgi:hypothetical protein
MLTACGTAYGNDVSLVKTGYLPLDQSVTVGNALDKYKYFKTTEWKSFITKKEQRIVEFNGIMDMGKLPYNFGQSVAESILIQFVINNDNKSFNPSYMEFNCKTKEGKKFKDPVPAIDFFKYLYQDKPLFDFCVQS